MAMKLIEFDNGLRMEVEATLEEIEQISGVRNEDAIERVENSLSTIEKILIQSINPVVNAYKTLNKEVSLEKVEVALGIGFSAEGNVFIAKGKGSANLKIKLTLAPKK